MFHHPDFRNFKNFFFPKMFLSIQLMCVCVCVYESVQLLSRVWLFLTPWTAAHKASLSITNSQSLLKLMFIESVMPSNHLIFCHPLLLLSSIFPSIRVFSTESVLCISWPGYWSFSFSISPSNEYSGLISFRIDWLDLLAVQGAGNKRQTRDATKIILYRKKLLWPPLIITKSWMSL